MQEDVWDKHSSIGKLLDQERDIPGCGPRHAITCYQEPSLPTAVIMLPITSNLLPSDLQTSNPNATSHGNAIFVFVTIYAYHTIPSFRSLTCTVDVVYSKYGKRS